MSQDPTNNIKSFSILTLGCSKNVVDSEFLIARLKGNELNYVQDISEADALIINTCGFIKPAKEENIQLIQEASELRRRNKLKSLIVFGCLAERYAAQLRTQLPFVDHIFGLNSNDEILKALVQNPKLELLGERELLTPRHYAYLKIADGCNHTCSFCAIPLIKGSYISKPKEILVKEAESLVTKGVKEIVMIAQDTTYYGIDLTGERMLADLLSSLSDIKGLEWIRLMYAFPKGFPDDVLKVMAERDNICKYVDIPFQHVSTNILKSMKRETTRQQIESMLEKIRKAVPEVAIRSTFIVGYPGETENDFKELSNFIKDAQLDRVGVFTYSAEEGTPAFPLGDAIPEDVKEHRRNTLMELQQSISMKKNRNKIGTSLKVLIDEKVSLDMYIGRTQHDAPDIDNAVYVHSQNPIEPGTFVNVKIDKAEEYDLYGRVV
ncbi:MAG: ribosomal protein S12 methylthiotransferase RimO [Ignavibacteria bacterium GWB2_35_12]|nr:MAG: ribosomal protein S12 methylthiotransferase RimO [Ignavibacteria bacterium GWA2_35_8]OGU42704.1 MAG: ribosomal protein S12 methylthiotransferase RimO [Ignavibacteria bacterium GWB2_35_12]OGU89359.1 MAG: ribosomal protein S12 methylthiotransferase RimO [Ignavibacteria bacterium RIFOXYA2_FULL_35_10]OGV19280.1 MAG: ribosomal protein S12 methylthiotransferase RimO [Ignavibacteria bacterium RIFOXYC2_FULL_35_21]